ncbi:MAG TPA: MaoC family dehydratase [Rugosimonospora sp.]|nr:MaoC family dehydratase [Rugosimonospora sp.]
MSEPKLAQHQLFKGTKDLSTAAIGDDLGFVEFTITTEMVERNAWANDDYNPWYMVDSPFGGRIASPATPLAYDGDLFFNYYAYPAGGNLFAKQEFEFIKPLFIGQTYRITGQLVEMYQRKGRTFYRVRMSVTDSDGVEVMRMYKTNASPVHPEPVDTEPVHPEPVQPEAESTHG